MATLPKRYMEPHTPEQTSSAAAAEIASLLEDHFDEMGWDNAERDARVTAASERINVAVQNAKHAK